jgi:hypothetical protein
MKSKICFILAILQYVISDDYLSYVLENNNYNIYYTKILMGSNDQIMNLLIDTKRSNILVGGNGCNSDVCLGQKYNENDSKMFKVKQQNYEEKNYGMSYKGVLASDLVNLHEIKTENAEIVVVNTMEFGDKLPVDGYFGLGFSKDKMKNIVYRLFKEGKINKPIYSLSLKQPTAESYIHVGGYDTKQFNQTTAISLPVEYSDNFIEWFTKVDKIKLNEKEYNQTFKFIINTASNILKVPRDFFFNNNLFDKSSECQVTKQNIFKCKCDASTYKSKFPNFTFYSSEGKTIQIKPDDYIYNNNDSETNSCLVYIALNYKNDYWVLGTNIINDYYTVYDLENDMVMFSQSNDKNGTDVDSTFLFCAIIFISAVIFFVIIHYIYKRIMNRQVEQNLI